MRQVITIGTFDILHTGHLRLLQKCAEISDKGYVTVGINTDEFVEKFKGQLPIVSYEMRSSLVGALKQVFATRRHDGNTARFLAGFDGGWLVVGSDWAKKDYHAQIGVTKEQLEDLDFTLLYVDYTEGVSSTALRAKVKKLLGWR